MFGLISGSSPIRRGGCAVPVEPDLPGTSSSGAFGKKLCSGGRWPEKALRSSVKGGGRKWCNLAISLTAVGERRVFNPVIRPRREARSGTLRNTRGGAPTHRNPPPESGMEKCNFLIGGGKRGEIKTRTLQISSGQLCVPPFEALHLKYSLLSTVRSLAFGGKKFPAVTPTRLRRNATKRLPQTTLIGARPANRSRNRLTFTEKCRVQEGCRNITLWDY